MAAVKEQTATIPMRRQCNVAVSASHVAPTPIHLTTAISVSQSRLHDLNYALGPNIVAGNPKVYEGLLETLGPLTPGDLRT